MKFVRDDCSIDLASGVSYDDFEIEAVDPAAFVDRLDGEFRCGLDVGPEAVGWAAEVGDQTDGDGVTGIAIATRRDDEGKRQGNPQDPPR